MNKKLNWGAGAITGLATVCVAATAFAQDSAEGFPSGTITILAPYSAGGPADAFTRLQAEFLSQHFDNQFVVENVTGAGGLVAARRLVEQDSDGYTWFSASSGLLTIIPAIAEEAGFDPAEELELVGVVRTQPLMIAARADAPWDTLDDLIADARERPGEISYASIGVNSLLHLAGEMLNDLAGIELLHVPYEGSAQYTVDLIGGRIDLAVSTPGTLVSHPDDLKALVQAAPERSILAPDVPTSAEAGLPDFVIESWTGIAVTADTDPALVNRISEMLQTITDDPAFVERAAAIDAQAIYVSGRDFADTLAHQREYNGRLIHEVAQ